MNHSSPNQLLKKNIGCRLFHLLPLMMPGITLAKQDNVVQGFLEKNLHCYYLAVTKFTALRKQQMIKLRQTDTLHFLCSSPSLLLLYFKTGCRRSKDHVSMQNFSKDCWKKVWRNQHCKTLIANSLAITGERLSMPLKNGVKCATRNHMWIMNSVGSVKSTEYQRSCV